MAKRFWELGGGGTLIEASNDPQVLPVSALQETLVSLQEVETLSDQLRTDIALNGGLPARGVFGAPDLATFDSLLRERIEVLQDVLDYPTYSTRQETFTVLDGAWITPEAVQSVSGEETGEEAVLAIDGDHGTWWQSNAGPHDITFRLRGYAKKISSVRLRTISSDNRSALQGVTLRGSRALANIDDPGNEIASGLNFQHDGDAWSQYDLTPQESKRVEYIKLEGFQSLHSDPDQVRIRTIEVFVTTTNHDNV